MTKTTWESLNLPSELREVLGASPHVHVAETVEELFELACAGRDRDFLDVKYELGDGTAVSEVTVARVRNGIAAN